MTFSCIVSEDFSCVPMKKLLLGSFLFGLVTCLCPQTFAKGIILTCSSPKAQKKHEINQFFGEQKQSIKETIELLKMNVFIDISTNLGTIDGDKGDLSTEQDKISVKIDKIENTNSGNSENDFKILRIDRKNLEFTYAGISYIGNSYYSFKTNTDAKGTCIKVAEKKENKI